jgi:hypothetical protein
VLAFRRAVIVTSIDAGAVRGDLADRLLAIDLGPIGDTSRREDGEVAAAFAAAHPAILGALLDLTAGVLRLLPTIRLATLPRMADYARVLAATDRIRGTDGLARYLGQRSELQREAAEGDRVGAALLAWAPQHLPWAGTASELLDALTPDRPPKDWPGTGRALSGSLRRLAQPLAAAGIVVTFEREAGSGSRRLVRLEQVRATVATVATVAAHSDGATLGDGRIHAESGAEELPWPTAAHPDPTGADAATIAADAPRVLTAPCPLALYRAHEFEQYIRRDGSAGCHACEGAA